MFSVCLDAACSLLFLDALLSAMATHIMTMEYITRHHEHIAARIGLLSSALSSDESEISPFLGLSDDDAALVDVFGAFGAGVFGDGAYTRHMTYVLQAAMMQYSIQPGSC